MKKILALVVVLTAIGHVYAAGTEPHSPVGMSVIKNGSVVKLFYRGEQTGKVKVTIYNDSGEVVFRETLQNRENFMRPYNFSMLPAGHYAIELSDVQGKYVRTVSHRSNDSKRAWDQKRAAHLSVVNPEEGRYLLTVPNKGTDELTVRIYDANNKLLYQETESVEGDFARLYNLPEVKGQHTFEVADKKGRTNRLTKAVR